MPSRSEENNKNNTIFRASYKVSMLLHVLSSTCRGEWNRGSLHSWPRSFSSRLNKCRLLVVYCAVYILLCIESLTLTSIRLRCCHFYEHVIHINSNTCSIKTLLFFQPNEPFFLFSHANCWEQAQLTRSSFLSKLIREPKRLNWLNFTPYLTQFFGQILTSTPSPNEEKNVSSSSSLVWRRGEKSHKWNNIKK